MYRLYRKMSIFWSFFYIIYTCVSKQKCIEYIEKITIYFHFSLNSVGCIGFNDTSTLVGHFASSPREKIYTVLYKLNINII